MTAPVLITGFHRSGTSAVARAFHSAGLGLGETLLGAEPANPYGHFEDEAAIALHDEVLAAEELTWKSTAALSDRSAVIEEISRYIDARSALSASSWGVKDPRLCLFLAEWIKLLPDAVVVFVLRAPGPTIASLHRRHVRRHVDTAGVDPSDLAFWKDPDLALKLWCHYHEQALPTLATHSSATLINYGLSSTDEAILEAIASTGLTPDQGVRLDPSLGRQSTSWVHDPGLIRRAGDIWNELQLLVP